MGLSVDTLTSEQERLFWQAVAEGERRSLRDDHAKAVRAGFGKDGVAAIKSLRLAWQKAPLSLRGMIADDFLSQVEQELGIEEAPPPYRDEISYRLFDLDAALARIQAMLTLSGKPSEHESAVAETAVAIWRAAGDEVAVGTRDAPSPMCVFVRDALLKYLGYQYSDKAIFKTEAARTQRATYDAVATLDRLAKLGAFRKKPRSRNAASKRPP